MKASKRNSLYISFFLLCLVFLSSCKSKKILQTDQGPISERTDVEILEALKSHNHQFDWYSCETSLKLISPEESIGAKSYIRMRKDSIIWINAKKYSTEGIRILATENTFAAINRIDRTYQKGSTKDAFEKLGLSLDFEDIQQALFGNVIIPDTTNMLIQKEGAHYTISGIDGDLQLKYWINSFTLHLDKLIIIDYRKRKITVEYDDYRELESGETVPFYRYYTMPFNTEENAEVIMNIKKIEVNVPKKTRFSIPSHYERTN